MRFVLLSCFTLLWWSSASAQPSIPRNPLPVLFIGQSNMLGSGGSDSSLTPNLSTAYGDEWIWKDGANAPYYGAGNLKRGIKDPMNLTSVTSRVSNKASMVPTCVQTVFELTGRKMYVSHYAIGATGMYSSPTTAGYWSPGSPTVKQSVNKTKGMLRQAEVPDSLAWLVLYQGETDGALLGQQSASYAPFPDSLVVDSAMTLSGAIVRHAPARGYRNPGKIQNAYTNRRKLLAYYRSIFGPKLGVIIVQIGNFGHQDARVPAGARIMQAVDAQVVKDERAAGLRTWLVRGQNEMPTVDGVHLTTIGLNGVGRKVGWIIAHHSLP